jgi:hypothetical protein
MRWLKTEITAALALAIMSFPTSSHADITLGISSETNTIPFGFETVGGYYVEIFSSSLFSGSTTFTGVSFASPAISTRFNPNLNLTISFAYQAVGFQGSNASESSALGTSIGSLGDFAILGSVPESSTLDFNGASLTYDPTRGNLVMDISVTLVSNVQSSGATRAAYNNDKTSATISSASNFSGDIFVTGGLVTTFATASTQPTPVPEPGTLVLMGGALAGLLAFRRSAKPRFKRHDLR